MSATQPSLFQRYYRLLFFTVLYAFYLVVVFGITDFNDAGHAGRGVVRFLAPALELGLALFLCAASVRMARRSERGWWLLPAAIVAAFVAVVYFAQIYSLYLSNDFISVLALQNTDSASFVKSPRALFGFAVIVAWILMFVFGLLRSGYGLLLGSGVGIERWPRTWFLSCVLILLVLNVWLLTLQNKSARLEPGFRQVPVSNLLVHMVAGKLGPAAGGDMHESTSSTISAGHDRCFTYASEPDFGAYPFQKNQVYTHALPFPATLRDNKRQPNVIVIFTEGLSARMINVYGGPIPGSRRTWIGSPLTPCVSSTISIIRPPPTAD